MSHPLEDLQTAALAEINAAANEQSLEAARVKYLGRSGSISAWGEQMKSLSKDEKPIVGKLLNEVRNALTAAIDLRAQQFRSQKESASLGKISDLYGQCSPSGCAALQGQAMPEPAESFA